MPHVENSDDSSQNSPVSPESTNPQNPPVQSTTYSPPNFDCVPNGGKCIHGAAGERCTNGYLSFNNCPNGQCCKLGLNERRSLLFTFNK